MGTERVYGNLLSHSPANKSIDLYQDFLRDLVLYLAQIQQVENLLRKFPAFLSFLLAHSWFAVSPLLYPPSIPRGARTVKRLQATIAANQPKFRLVYFSRMRF